MDVKHDPNAAAGGEFAVAQLGFLNRNELRFISKVSQKFVKTQNRGKMSTNRGGESGLDFD